MTREQNKIVQKWVESGLMQPSKYWPFTQYQVKQLAKDRKAETQKRINDAGEALL
jgi:hypothetical protein